MPSGLNFLRHGEASPSGPAGDASRPLTPRGEQTLRELAQRLARDGWRPDRVFTSPFLRARESAAILTRGLGLELPCDVLVELEPECDPESALDALESRGALEGQILVVGHQPQLGRLVTRLTGDPHGLAAGELIRVECVSGAIPIRGRITLVLRPGDQE